MDKGGKVYDTQLEGENTQMDLFVLRESVDGKFILLYIMNVQRYFYNIRSPSLHIVEHRRNRHTTPNGSLEKLTVTTL